jgi:predicted small lipoprotein YifL
MKISLTLLFCVLIAACGRKDALTLPPEPATATQPAKPERPLTQTPAAKSFVLDAIL